jgi:plasmid maintenance system killer protein
VNRVRRILTALIAAPDIAGVRGPPRWRIHHLTGDRAGRWSNSASRKWRIMFTLHNGETRGNSTWRIATDGPNPPQDRHAADAPR